MMEPELMTVDDTAGTLGLSPPTVRRLIREGVLPAVQLGGKGHALRIRRADINRLLEPQPTAAGSNRG
jgi:excisionase family DNA binding protein